MSASSPPALPSEPGANAGAGASADADADLRQAMLATSRAILIKQTRTERELSEAREHLHQQNVALSSVNALLSATLDATPLGVMACNLRGEVVRSNQRLEAMFPPPTRAGGDVALSAAQRLGPCLQARRELEDWLSAVLAAPERTHTLQASTPDGRLLSCQAVPQWADERCVGVVLNWLDVTEQYDRARLLAEAESARQASAAQSAFLSRASHELRTPLNAVVGFSHLLGKSAVVQADPKAARQVSLIQSAGSHLAALVDDLLLVSKLETDELRLRDEAVDLHAVLHEAADMLAVMATEHQVSLNVDVPAVARVRGDRSRLRQVLLNLAGNAIKYNRPAGSVALLAQCDGEVWAVQVRDTGLGMTTEQQAHLFEPFNRLGAEELEVDGTGLGLYISRRLLLAMKGSISVHSEPGMGSTFTLSLPQDHGPSAAGE